MTATDISTGTRVGFQQGTFDFLLGSACGAPVASGDSVVGRAVRVFAHNLNNYGGTCHNELPAVMRPFADSATTPRPATRLLTMLHDLQSYENARRPFVHLFDGGL